MSLNNEIILGIDASNIRHGGGITHLSQLLAHTNPEESKIKSVVVWSNENTLRKLPNQPWLSKKTHRLLNGNFFQRILWQAFNLNKELNDESCGILFVPGASYITKFKPVVTMHQNLLPFENTEILRYGLSFFFIKLILLRFTQSLSFKRSEGIIFLSEYSRNALRKYVNLSSIEEMTIPHGIEKRFFKKPREQFYINHYSNQKPYKLIYVSSIDLYKHQWKVIEAVHDLRSSGYPITLELYGKLNDRAKIPLMNAMERFDSNGEFIRLNQEVPFNEIHNIYHEADLSIFASSCETFGQIVLESMASGIPICCSRGSSMCEILSGGARYFDPMNSKEIKSCLKEVIDSPILRSELSSKSFSLAKRYDWEFTAKESFRFFTKVYENSFRVK